MTLDLSPLANALARLEGGLDRYGQEISDAQIRDGLIQRFEFSYDLTHKMLRRALAQQAATPREVAEMSFPNWIRAAADRGVPGTRWSRWHDYRRMRNISSHTYDEAKAVEVVGMIPEFLDDARSILVDLQEKV